MKKAILFLTFNRLDTVKKVFEQIKMAKPPRLYLASDGPRKDIEGEKEKIEEVRDWLLGSVNWNCEVKTLFHKENYGCGKSVSGAITWFFENEPDGIILEDDCLPNQSFFNFCEELLDYYKDEKKVWVVSGNQFLKDDQRKESYYFAKIMHCWGWASWADRWKHYQYDLSLYDEKNVEKFSKNARVRCYWRTILERMKAKKIDTWDYQWTFCIVANDGLCINPSKNLVSNIGSIGTHISENNPNLFIPTFDMKGIIHNRKLKFDKKAVDYIYKNVFNLKSDFSIFKKEEKYDKLIVTLFNRFKLVFKKNIFYFNEQKLFEKLKNQKRFKEKTIEIKKYKIKIADAPSVAYQIKDIFIDENYKFNSIATAPLIIDCGSNIGLSILYFKLNYPESHIKAFEPDKKIFTLLKENVGNFEGVELFNKAIWINNEDIIFNSEGADGGSLINEIGERQETQAQRLKDILYKEEKIDFLKIDIEGSEIEVLEDCKDELMKVKNIFIEYHSFVNKKQELDKILKILNDKNFRYHVENATIQDSPLSHMRVWNNMDLQVNIWGFKND